MNTDYYRSMVKRFSSLDYLFVIGDLEIPDKKGAYTEMV